jgi:HEAT repeat protein
MTDDMRGHLRTISTGERVEIWEAARKLTELHASLVQELLRLLSGGPAADARSAAAYVLGFCRIGAARAALERSLEDKAEDPLVRGYAAEALGYLGESASLEPLLQQLDDPDICVRYWCVFALGQIGDARAIPFLEGLRAGLTGTEKCGQHDLGQEIADMLQSIANRADS